MRPTSLLGCLWVCMLLPLERYPTGSGKSPMEEPLVGVMYIIQYKRRPMNCCTRRPGVGMDAARSRIEGAARGRRRCESWEFVVFDPAYCSHAS